MGSRSNSIGSFTSSRENARNSRASITESLHAALPLLPLEDGRPDVEALLESLASGASEAEGHAAVYVCGPQALERVVLDAASGHSRITVHSNSFVV